MMEHKGECKLTIGKDLDFTQVWSFGVAKNLLPVGRSQPSQEKSIESLRFGRCFCYDFGLGLRHFHFCVSPRIAHVALAL